VADGDYDPVEEANGPKAVFSFSAVFAEVRVDPDLGLVRLNRFVGAYDAGRIINPKTARSQAIGGIIWGVGQALLEQSETDPVMGRFLNRNYSGYLAPTNADIPELDVLFVGEFDEEETGRGQWAPSWSDAQRRGVISPLALSPIAKASTPLRSFSRAFIARFVGPSMNGSPRKPGCASPSRPRDHLAQANWHISPTTRGSPPGELTHGCP
jgi:Molybdopterin-binding domain of aldehyde dehydrogenase